MIITQVSDDPVRTEHVTITSQKSSTPMRCVVWQGTKSVAVETRPKPAITDTRDAIVRVTTAAICGSDLHLYVNAMPGMRSGDILGHEAMGIVESVGADVQDVQPGDRVVVPFDIACGSCFFCEKKLYSACDRTNPSKEQEALYGSRTAGIYGYSHLTGWWYLCVVHMCVVCVCVLTLCDHHPAQSQTHPHQNTLTNTHTTA